MNEKVRKSNTMNINDELVKSYNESIFIPSENKVYEDVYTLAMDDSAPVKYIIAGITNQFSNYKNKRPATRKHFLFEYIYSGKGHIFIQNKWHELKKGDMFFLGKYDDRNFYADYNDPMKKIYVSFASEYIDSMILHYSLKTGIYKIDVKKCFEDIYNAVSSDLIPQKEKIFTVTENIHKIIMLAAVSKEQVENSLADKIENELLDSVYTKVNLDTIAAKFFTTKTNLIRVFRLSKGITPYRFLLNERIKIAKALFSTTNLSVKAVSEKLCFADEHYFSHLFKEKVGMSALEYKSNRKNVE